jgi:hypothetical protein
MDLRGSWRYITDTARNRLATNKTVRHVEEYGDAIEVLGVAGEVTARRFLGLPEEVHAGFDGGADIVYCGMRIDVKATVLTPKVNFRFLQWPKWKQIKADFVLLTAIDPISQQSVILGYATPFEILNSKLNETRDYPCYEIEVTKLHPGYMLVVEALKRQSDAWRS